MTIRGRKEFYERFNEIKSHFESCPIEGLMDTTMEAFKEIEDEYLETGQWNVDKLNDTVAKSSLLIKEMAAVYKSFGVVEEG